MSFCLPQRRKVAKFRKNKFKYSKQNENNIKSLCLRTFAANHIKKKSPSKHPKILVFGSRQDGKRSNQSGFLRGFVFR
jgi:hypothetical protein